MNILVLSRNSSLYSTQSIVNAGRRRGHFMRVIDHMQCDLVMEGKNLQVYYQDELIDDYDAIIPRIGDAATSYGSAVVRQFQLMGLFSTLDYEALLRARNKISSMQLLAAHGIGVPKTVISNNSYTIEESLDYLGRMPLVIKLAQGTHGIGVLLAENKKNAGAIIETFHKLKQRVILQEFVAEAKGADIRVLIVDDKITGSMKRQARTGEFRSNLHRGGNSTVVRLTEAEAYAAKQAAKIMGLDVCGVDMLRSKKGPLILEVNASPGLEGIETTTKIDIAGKIIQFCERNAEIKA